MKPHFGLETQKVQEITSLLTEAVANTYSLAINTLSCHWNLEDSSFLFLHEMLQEQYEHLLENGDLLAERIRQMGEKVPASVAIFAKNQTLSPIKETATCKEMLDQLALSHEKLILSLRKLSSLGEKHEDFGLVDLLGSILRDHEKTAWILRSHL
jgi:starvation-inducible DNA-binding protein